jgi:hypothetical protein
MPMPNAIGQPTDVELLSAFVWTLYEDVDAIVDLREVLFLAPTDFHHGRVVAVRRMEAAWIEVLESRARVIDTVASGDPLDYRLETAGLAGEQLRFKNEIWLEARTIMASSLADSDDVEERPRARPRDETPDPSWPIPPALPRKMPRRAKWALKWISRALGHADTILGSLTGLIGLSESLKEFKESLEKLAAETSEDIED